MGKIIQIHLTKSELYRRILQRGEPMKVPTKEYTLPEFEEMLALWYKGRLCSFTYPGYNIVYGMCEEISVDTAKLPEKEIVIQLGRSDGIHRYTCSIETLSECLKVINNGNH